MRVIRTSSPDPPPLPAGVMSFALEMAREEAVVRTEARAAILLECASEIESYAGRLLVPGSRDFVTELEAEEHDMGRALPMVPAFPDSSGVELVTLTVRRWAAGDWAASTHVARPGLRLELPTTGEFEVSATVSVAAPMLNAAVEALTRLFGFRETRRSGDTGDALAPGPLNLSAGMRRSGAADILRAGIRQVRTG